MSDGPVIDPRLDVVRALWSVYRERGLDAAIALLDERVEFVDHAGRTFHGRDGVRAFFDNFRDRGEEFRAFPYSFESHGSDVLVVGHRRIRRGPGTEAGPLYFVHSVEGVRVRRIAAHVTREAALADSDARAR